MAKNFCGCIQNGQRFSSTPSTTRRISRSFFFLLFKFPKRKVLFSHISKEGRKNIYNQYFKYYKICRILWVQSYICFIFTFTLLLLTVQFALHMSVNYTHRLFSKYCQIVIWGAISTPRVDNCKDRRLKLMKYDLAIHIIMSFDNEERILKLYVHF